MVFAVCHGGMGIKKALHPQRGTKDKRFRGTTHIRHNNAALFRIQIYPIPVTEEIRQRLIRQGSAPQLRRELHRTGVCVRFQSCRTLPESRTWNNYFPLSSLCAIFVLIILPMPRVVNAKIVTVLFHEELRSRASDSHIPQTALIE